MIDIPGYRIQRVLGQGGMATVYLAVQESVQREVALKVMSPTLVGAEFGERFLREARIAARLHHPNVVQVHDVGKAAELHYIAMEYLAGGPVLRRGEPRGVDHALRVTREIAGALGYAHVRGVVHRDIKPDNILLREDGTAVLTDFGIARASDSARMTIAGMIMGTPHYMAPEQARGAAIDGRADLYSLGVVLFELLTDRVPYNADDWVAVGLMHMSAPVPQLPDALAGLQPLLERMLAKDPNQRVQSGAELVAAIEEVEQARAGPAKRRRPRPAEAPAAPVAAEPSLGALSDVFAAPTPRHRRQAAGRLPPRRWPWLVFGLIALATIAGFLLRDTLAPLLPQTRFEALLDRADQALREGRLSDPAGNGARELYSRALALDPDDEHALAGLRQLGDAFVARARGALAEQRLRDARDALAAARELGVAASVLDPLEQDIRQREYRDVELETVLRDAQQALAAGRLDDGDRNAVALYRQALAGTPDNELAKAGLRDTLAQLLDRARAQIQAGELDAAERQIEAVHAIDPAHLALAPARAALAEARQQRQVGLQQQLDAVEALLRRGRLTAPAGDNARDAYRALQRQYPDEPRIAEGLRRVATALLAAADRALADFDFDSCRRLLAEARASGADPAGLRRVEQRLAELEQGQAGRLAAPLDAAQQQRIALDLQAATAALGRGELLAPPGDSAYDRYKAVLAVDPDNAGALAGVAALPAVARQRFEDSLGSGQLSRARGYVEALETLAPDDAALPDIKRRLARSLLGYAAERLGAGELDRARTALDTAAVLDPRNPDLPALQARLEQASR